jgi:alpha-glucosidase
MTEHEAPFLRGKVVYQIYPRSFFDASGDGVGDLKGITARLDYLNDGTPDSLGINIIWLSPFYPSPMADFGYDISNYRDVDPTFGTLDDFRELVAGAHERGIRLMIDFVPNHTSSQHPWFLESKSSRDNSKRDWYIWHDPNKDGSPPNNWLSVFGGSGWELDPSTGQYYFHSFLREQPDLNWDNPEVRAAMRENIRFWMDLGVDAIRVDAVDWMGKDTELRDDPPNPHYQPGVDDPYHEFEHRYSSHDPILFSYLHGMASVVKEYPRGFMVTETYPDRRNIVAEYTRLYDNYLAEVSAPFNFEGIKLPWRAVAFKTFVDSFQAALKPHHVPVYVLGNHDNSRLASRIGPRASRTAALMLLTLPGVAFIYYGEELGMYDGHIPPHRVQDPFEKRVPGLGLGRDPNRTPMQWSGRPHAGFSRIGVEPWLPVPPTYTVNNVSHLSQDSGSIFTLYRKLIQLRNSSPILQHGGYVPLDLDNAYVFGFLRRHNGNELAVLLNFSGQPAEIHSGLGRGALFYNTHGDAEGLPIDLSRHTLRPHEGQIVALLS